MAIRLTQEEFIKKSQEIHGNKYNYSKVIYAGNRRYVSIVCPIHGEFKQIASSHMRGKGCKKCEGFNKTTEEFINEAREIHGDKYDYSLVEYINSTLKVKIICSIHGMFEIIPYAHLYGSGCPKCKGYNKTTEEFISEAREIHGDKYDYTLTNFVDNKHKVAIICPIHGLFETKPNNHLSGKGCPKCRCSHGETKIRNFLQKNNIQFKEQVKFDDCKNKRPLPFDFAIYNGDRLLCLIEYDGKQHYSSIDFFGGDEHLQYVQQNDYIKTEYCKKNNISLIRITYLNDVDEVLNTIDFEQ